MRLLASTGMSFKGCEPEALGRSSAYGHRQHDILAGSSDTGESLGHPRHQVACVQRSKQEEGRNLDEGFMDLFLLVVLALGRCGN